MGGEQTASDGTRRSLPIWVPIAAAVGLGALVAAQGRVSAALAQRSDVYNGAWVTVITGTTILLVILALSPKARMGFRRVGSGLRSRTLPWWTLAGGACGIFFVVTQGTAAGPLGLAMFGMAVVAGQVVGGLIFDWVGLSGDGKRHPTRLRVLGSLLAVGAVSWGAVAGEGAKIDVLLILMAFISGVGLALNSGLNGRVQGASSSPPASGLVNHLVGLLAIVTILVVTAPGHWDRFSLPNQPWLYLGGVIGPIGIAMSAVLVGRLGVLLLGLGMVAGQLIGALVLELIVPTAGGGIQVASVVGIALTLAAVGITSLDGRTKRSADAAETSTEPAPHDRATRPREAGEPSGSAAA